MVMGPRVESGLEGVGKMQGVLLGRGCCGDGGLHLEMALSGS